MCCRCPRHHPPFILFFQEWVKPLPAFENGAPFLGRVMASPAPENVSSGWVNCYSSLALRSFVGADYHFARL
jgi:hypothetical protein